MSINISVDNREKKPLPFPSTLQVMSPTSTKMTTVPVKTTLVRLEQADYILGDDSEPTATYGSPSQRAVVIERKHTLDEIAQNLTRKRSNFLRVLDRMAEVYQYRHLIFDCHPSQVVTPTAYTKNPGRILDDLIRLTYSRQINLMFLPASTPNQRRAVGEIVARLLYNGDCTPCRPPTSTRPRP